MWGLLASGQPLLATARAIQQILIQIADEPLPNHDLFCFFYDFDNFENLAFSISDPNEKMLPLIRCEPLKKNA